MKKLFFVLGCISFAALNSLATFAVSENAELLTQQSGQSPADEQEPEAVKMLHDRVTQVTQPLIDNGWAEAIMVGVVHLDQEAFFAYGSVDDKTEVPPTADTVFEIGSITKVFTSIVLAEMATKGQLSLEDPVEKYLPESLLIPSPDETPITLKDLASHTSGLPNISANFWNPGDDIFDNDTAGRRWGGFSMDKLASFLEKPTPAMDANRKFIYSNLGAGMLGLALQRQAQTPIGDLIRERVCLPLGMKSTGIEIESDCLGHDADGRVAIPWDANESILVGAFALRSTCRDMLAFAKANMNMTGTSLDAALALAQTPGIKIDPNVKTALGWKINRFGVVYTTGATGGFRSSLFLHPKSKTAVVVLSNTQVGGATGKRALQFDSLAGSILNLTLGGQPIPIDLPAMGTAQPENYSDYVGMYAPPEGTPGPSFPVSLSDGVLTVLGPGERQLPMITSSEDKFFLRGHDSRLDFKRDKNGKVVELEFHFEGNKAMLIRSTDEK